MKIEVLHPELKNMPMQDLVVKVPMRYAVMFSDVLAEYYDSKIGIVDIYRYYGVGIRTRIGHQFQVQCLLPSHGSLDEHSSARYYEADRNTGEVRPRVYCFKCGKVNTLFWMLYRIEEARGRKFGEMFDFIWRIFGVEFPREIFLNLDPETAYVLERDTQNELLRGRMHADRVRGMKILKPQEYLKELKNMLSGGNSQNVV